MNIKALAVTSVSASKSVALSHTPLAPVPAVVTTYIPLAAPLVEFFTKILFVISVTPSSTLGAPVI
jgi:hypothetical protein